jgi:hypothetical protein
MYSLQLEPNRQDNREDHETDSQIGGGSFKDLLEPLSLLAEKHATASTNGTQPLALAFLQHNRDSKRDADQELNHHQESSHS